MTTEATMTDATTTTEGQTASGTATGQPATGAGEGGQQQQASTGQETQGQATDNGQSKGEQQQQQKPAGAPEKYDFKAAEGITLDDSVVGAFSEVAKELNLTQDAAQKVLDKVAPVMAARQAEQLQSLRTAWADGAKADKEFGGDKFDENLAIAKKGLETFGTPELRALLDESGLGNHPEVVRVFYRAGKAISEDRVVTGASGSATTQSTAQRMYPNMNP